MFSDLQANIELMQRQLQTWQRGTGKARCRDNPALLFKDFKDDPAPPVETLVEGRKAVVAEVDEDAGCATLVDEVAWIPEAPFLKCSRPLTVHHAEPDALFGTFQSFAQVVRSGNTSVWQTCRICLQPFLMSGAAGGFVQTT